MKYNKSFSDKIALVTGGGSGLGQAICILLAENGATVLCTDKNFDLAQNTVSEIKSKNHDSVAQAYCMDVANESEISSTIDTIRNSFGKIDYLFNNAGISIWGEINDFETKHWKNIIDINLMGVVTCATKVYRLMIKQKHGHIVNIASISGLLDYTAYSTPYAVTKHGVVTYSKGLQLEALDYNVKVTTVCPGAIRTSIGKNMEQINGNEKSRQFSIDFIDKGISPYSAAKTILDSVAKNRKLIVLPSSFKIYYRITRFFRSIEKAMTTKMITQFREDKQTIL